MDLPANQQTALIVILFFAVILSLFRHYLAKVKNTRRSIGVHKRTVIDMKNTGLEEKENEMTMTLEGVHPETGETVQISHLLPSYTRKNQGDNKKESIRTYYNLEKKPLIEVRVENANVNDYLIVDERF